LTFNLSGVNACQHLPPQLCCRTPAISCFCFSTSRRSIPDTCCQGRSNPRVSSPRRPPIIQRPEPHPLGGSPDVFFFWFLGLPVARDNAENASKQNSTRLFVRCQWPWMGVLNPGEIGWIFGSLGHG